MAKISVIAADSLMVVDGVVLVFPLPLPEIVWALHLDEAAGKGHVELRDGGVFQISNLDDFPGLMDAYLAEKAKLPPSEGHVSDGSGGWIVDLEKYKARKLDELEFEYLKNAPATVECVVGNKTYLMAADIEAARLLEYFCRKAERNGDNSLVITDADDADHTFSIEEGYLVSDCMADGAGGKKDKEKRGRRRIKAVKVKTDLQAAVAEIDVIFSEEIDLSQGGS